MSSTGFTVRDVPAADFCKEYADHLKNQRFELPENVDLIKTGIHKELAPYDDDWYYLRAASIARKVYLRPGVGVGFLSRKYGGQQRRGYRPKHHKNGSRKIIRHILQQLQNLELVVGSNESDGRFVTPQGQRDLDAIAKKVGLELLQSRQG